jgi:hypothetical protein
MHHPLAVYMEFDRVEIALSKSEEVITSIHKRQQILLYLLVAETNELRRHSQI